MSRASTLRWLSTTALAVVAVGGAVAAALEHSASASDIGLIALMTVLVGSPLVVGILVLRRHPSHLIGWLLLAHAALMGLALASPDQPGHSTASVAFAQLSGGWWVGFYLGLILIAYVFPDGRFASPRWRRWVLLCLVGYVAFVLGTPFDATRYRALHADRPAPLPLAPQWVATSVTLPGIALVALSLIGAVVCVYRRMRAATGEARLQLLWLTGATACIPAMLGMCFLDGAINGHLGNLTLISVCALGSMMPIAIGLAILRYGLWDIELIVSRTLTYGALTAAVVGTYGLVLWSTDRLLDNRPLAQLLGVGIVAVLVQPAHSLLRRRIERLVYGDRSEPVAAMRRLSQHVEQAEDPSGVIDAVTDAVAEAVRASRAWVELAGEEDCSSRGDERVVRLPLAHRGERLGDLAVELPRGRQLSPGDLALLQDLARHAATVVMAALLATDLQQSRARLVAAREEERRRLRRDLHDGLGPSLAAIVLKLNNAEGQADPDRRVQLLAEARQETRTAIAEVRRLVDGLRPPAIDEVGLIGAIRQAAASLCSPDLSIEVSGPVLLPVLPAAIEVATFRIASEAMTNVQRHAQASRCHVRISTNGAFELSVSDDGRGAPPGTPPGVGWTSMSDRAAELGGTCTITSRAGGGTLVRAVLPLSSSASDREAVSS